MLLVPLLLVACTSPATDEPAARDLATSSSSATPSDSASASPGAAVTSRAPHGDGTRIIVADSPYGPMLYDATGQAIYLFDLEQGRPRPRCYQACAAAWPPVLTEGAPVAARGVRPALLGTTQRRDGRSQVTYNGHPLYFYAHEGPYQVLCHDIDEYGGTWLVVQPNGAPAP